MVNDEQMSRKEHLNWKEYTNFVLLYRNGIVKPTFPPGEQKVQLIYEIFVFPIRSLFLENKILFILFSV